MTSETLPEYNDLFSLDSDKLSEIETKCYNKGHLDPNEKLLDRIKQDTDFLKSKGVTKEDIYTNHRNMYLKFNKTNEYDAYTINNHELVHNHAKDLMDNLPEGFGHHWSCKGMTTNEINLNGQHLRISCVVWGGAEECPIETSFSDEYHGYSRGDRDWFVTNLDKHISMWIPDLVPAQAGMFGFFQSPISPYRIDPAKYLELAGIGGSIELVKSHKVHKWGFGSGPANKETVLKKLILKEEDNEQYHAYLCNENGKDKLCINFKDPIWIEENKEEKITVFDLPFSLDAIFNTNGYLLCDKSYSIVLDERDDSETMRKIYQMELKIQMEKMMSQFKLST